MYELPPEERQQITQELHYGYTIGGIQAAAYVVNNLAVEQATLKIYHDEFKLMEREGEDLGTIAKLADLVELVTFVDEIQEDHEHAMGRYAYALTTLYDLQAS